MILEIKILGQAKKCGRVKLVKGTPTLLLVIGIIGN
jgi:hypothetical protein